ncbi:YPR078C [Saccharomyces arboricola H-6]|uniref:YPR078C n=1 Tax=Saccharomyces arboricola (strain H-6 / AS 2.3317 / CBS 10644) TaxID=1160507 RepID=J8Q133_SACAR|nr:YPR078C [Saccharomyces arboricola H-6]
MQSVSGLLPTTLSPSELRSSEDNTCHFDGDGVGQVKQLNEGEDLRKLKNATAQLGIRVNHIHDKTDQEIARLEKVIESVTKNNSHFHSCSSRLKNQKHTSSCDKNVNSQLISHPQFEGGYGQDWKRRMNKWFRKNKSQFTTQLGSDYGMTEGDGLLELHEELLEEGKTPYSSETDGFMKGLNIISPLTPDDLDNSDTCVKIDEPSLIHPVSEFKKPSSSPTFGNYVNKELVTNDTESIISEPPLRENKKTVLKYQTVRTHKLGTERSPPRGNGGMFSIFRKSASSCDKNQENMSRMWDVVRDNLGKEVYLLQERFKKWTARHQDSGKDQLLNDDSNTVPLSLSDPGTETELKSMFSSLYESETRPAVQA